MAGASTIVALIAVFVGCYFLYNSMFENSFQKLVGCLSEKSWAVPTTGKLYEAFEGGSPKQWETLSDAGLQADAQKVMDIWYASPMNLESSMFFGIGYENGDVVYMCNCGNPGLKAGMFGNEFCGGGAEFAYWLVSEKIFGDRYFHAIPVAKGVKSVKDVDWASKAGAVIPLDYVPSTRPWYINAVEPNNVDKFNWIDPYTDRSTFESSQSDVGIMEMSRAVREPKNQGIVGVVMSAIFYPGEDCEGTVAAKPLPTLLPTFTSPEALKMREMCGVSCMATIVQAFASCGFKPTAECCKNLHDAFDEKGVAPKAMCIPEVYDAGVAQTPWFLPTSYVADRLNTCKVANVKTFKELC